MRKKCGRTGRPDGGAARGRRFEDQSKCWLRRLEGDCNPRGHRHRVLRGARDSLDHAEGTLIAALFGFTGIAAATAGIAKILFFIFIVICVIFLVLGLMAGRAIF